MNKTESNSENNIESLPYELPKIHNFDYDKFQQDAINAVKSGKNVLVSAPTGSGKTVIADYVIADAISSRRSVIYTAPIKTLSNQKYRDFCAAYGSNLAGIVTGDVVINSGAAVRIMTTEIYRNTLLDNPKELEDVSWIIFDEVHYLNDAERGTVWEESIMLTPESIKMVCLSATVPNINELADWMRSSLKRETVVVIEDKRIVPLHLKYQCNNKIYDSLKAVKEHGYSIKVPSMSIRHRGKIIRKPIKFLDQNKFETLINTIIEADGLPCIYFLFGRKITEELASQTLQIRLVDKQQSRAILTRYDELCIRRGVTGDPIAKRMRLFVQNSVAYHHAGMLPTMKEIIEQLFTDKLIKIIFTTETFALGINMPARSVVFDSMRKFYKTGFDVIKTRDFYQMAGRAGRRGMDTEGFVYVKVSPNQVKYDRLLQTVTGEPAPVLSQFNASYATILNLYKVHGEDILALYPLTLHCYQASKNERRLARERVKNRIAILKFLGFIKNNQLTKIGEFASWMFGYELYLSEMFESGLLDQYSIAELCCAISCIVYEARPNNCIAPKILEKYKWIYRNLKKIYANLHNIEYRFDVEDEIKEPQPHLINALDAWLKGAEFNEIVELTNSDEGEIVRYFRMIIQLLRQIENAPYTSEKLKKTAYDARMIMNRDVIDAERQLRSL